MKNWLNEVVCMEAENHPDGVIRRPVTRGEMIREDAAPIVIWLLVIAVVAGLVYLGSR